ncbi:MAG TPA: RnfABCDGE type electron transport complex subunit G [Prolixibacteraceae bacterium]|nr:RnfABCDGE type electron transport complex subunit G [Prolixibacteraceae bacterium]
MAKPQSTFRNMLTALFGVTFIASAILGLVFDLTKGPIAKAELNKQTSAVAAVLPEFNFLGTAYKLLPADGIDSIEVFPAFDADSTIIACAIKSYTNKGFSGDIEIMVGIDNEGLISGYQVLKHAETPGLGSKMNEWFSNTEKASQNIIGRNISDKELRVSKDGGDVDAITAATISSRAFLDAINRANNTVNNQYSNGNSSATKKNDKAKTKSDNNSQEK